MLKKHERERGVKESFKEVWLIWILGCLIVAIMAAREDREMKSDEKKK